MKKKILLTIPEPCHEDWQQMTPLERGRFCGACQKTVVDFSSMRDGELIRFFQKQQAGVCGRFQAHQLDRTIYKPKAPWPFVKYFFQATLPAFLLSLKATSQERTVGKIAVCQNETIGAAALIKDGADSTLHIRATGKVVDENGVGIPYASITLEKSLTGTLCDSNGKFEVSGTLFFEKPIVVSAVGYASKTMMLEKGNDTTIVLNLNAEALLGEVAVIGFVSPKLVKEKPIKNIPLLPLPSKPETVFMLFPNPVLSGATVTMRWNDLIKGNYIVQLQSASGQKVWTGQTSVTSKNSAYTFRLPQLPAGTYILKIICIQTSKSYSEKIVIQ